MDLGSLSDDVTHATAIAQAPVLLEDEGLKPCPRVSLWTRITKSTVVSAKARWVTVAKTPYRLSRDSGRGIVGTPARLRTRRVALRRLYPVMRRACPFTCHVSFPTRRNLR